MSVKSKIIVASGLLVLLSTIINAQTGYEDVVYLKNGGLTRGIIIEQVPNESLKIQTRDKNIFVYRIDEIEKITKEKLPGRVRNSDSDSYKTGSFSGFAFSLDGCIGQGINSVNKEQSMIGVHPFFGYMHKSKYIFGLAIGFTQYATRYDYNNQYTYHNGNEYIPFDCSFAFRFMPLRKRISPLLATEIGYAIMPPGTYDTTTGGLMLNLGAGGRINLSDRRGINMSINYRYQKISVTDEYYNSINGGTIQESNTLSFENICLQLGITF